MAGRRSGAKEMVGSANVSSAHIFYHYSTPMVWGIARSVISAQTFIMRLDSNG